MNILRSEAVDDCNNNKDNVGNKDNCGDGSHSSFSSLGSRCVIRMTTGEITFPPWQSLRTASLSVCGVLIVAS